ncbi:MAG TPA: response regulator transcription factor [Sphingomicrobium sp.]|nr:response regulator transcription factor [Sphingomicrobium sp.]
MTNATKTVMLADPHCALRAGVRKLLESTGRFEISASVREDDAIATATEVQPDIAVVELSKPDADREEVVAGLKRASPKTKIVVYTSVAAECSCVRMASSGVDAIVFKSDAEDQLLAALASVSVGRSYFSATMPDNLLALGRRKGPITAREQEILELIASGMSNSLVAQRLGISPKTVETHRAKVSEKLNCRTTADLVRYALRNRLIAA